MGLLAFAVLATVALAFATAGAQRGCAGDPCAEGKDDPTGTRPGADAPGPLADLAPRPAATPAHPAPTPTPSPTATATPTPTPAPAHSGAPASEAPASQPPHSEAPPSEAPASQPPHSEAPPSEAPASQPPHSEAPAVHPAPVSRPGLPKFDVSGAAAYVRAFYTDLSNGDYEAAWPLLAADLRERHGSFDAWKKGFATTVSQSAAGIAAKPAGVAAATVSLTLTAVDQDACKREITRRFAVTWRLEHQSDVWRALHAEARALKPSPTAVVASC